jgi:hypothetical protein
MMDKIGIESLTSLGAWDTCRLKELGGPHLGVVIDDIGAFFHNHL